MDTRQQKGFTLIEVLVVVFILGILAALVAPKMLGRTDDAKIAQTKLQMKNLETALKLYKLDSGMFPTTDQGLEALGDSHGAGMPSGRGRGRHRSGKLEIRDS